MSFKKIFLFIFLFPLFLQAQNSVLENQIISKANELALFKDRQWLKLLHYEHENFFSFQSQVDGASFFLSSNGKKDPKAELEATIHSFFSDEKDEKLSAFCRFPARLMYLKKHIPEIDKVKSPVECTHFQNFFTSVRGPSVTLVFSSYYLNNPSSTFGHTFLRVNKAPSSRDGRRYELLDYGLNYAAWATTNNALLYGIYGVAGFFPGVFTTVPYYYKVREYSDFESRDLWEYELKLSPEQVDVLVAHTWELAHTHLDYFYLTENCSYHMLSILEAADPSLEILSHLKTWVIPADSVKTVFEIPGLVTKVNYRPAIRSIFNERLARLSSSQKDIVLEIVKQKNFSNLEKLTLEEKRNVLDAAIDFIDFEFAKDLEHNEEAKKQKNQILILRSEISLPSEDIKIEPSEVRRPHLSHGSRRVSLGSVRNQDSGKYYSSFQYRFALHDLLDPQVGYLSYSQIEMFNFKFSNFNSAEEARLEHMRLMDIVSLTPWNEFTHQMSWNFRLGLEQAERRDCLDCRVTGIGGGTGITLEPLDFFQVVPTLQVRAQIGEGPSVFGIGPSLLMRYQENPYFSILLNAQYRLDVAARSDDLKEKNAYVVGNAGVQYSFNKSIGLRLNSSLIKDLQFHEAQLQFYY